MRTCWVSDVYLLIEYIELVVVGESWILSVIFGDDMVIYMI